MATSKVPPEEMERVRKLGRVWQQVWLDHTDSPAHELVLRLNAELDKTNKEAGLDETDQRDWESVVVGFHIPTDPTAVKQPLALLHDAKRGMDMIDRAMDALVTECRRRGYSWADIAAALNVARQSAWTKYASLEDAGAH